jgi:hypothetical protein
MKLTRFIITSMVVASSLSISMVRPARSKPNPTDITAMTTGICGVFTGNNWGLEVTDDYTGVPNHYDYSMTKYESKKNEVITKKNVFSRGGRLTKADGKHYYRWNNGGTIYQVTWKPSDSEYARVEVFERGNKVFNQLLKIGYGDCD